MLRGIRTASANWLGKIVMGVVVGILALSFAIWGIGDIFRGFGRSTLASVGSVEITAEQFRQIYTERMQQIAAQFGPIPPDRARAMGLDRQILGEVIRDTALEEWARRLGLGITDAEVARLIRTIPAFQGADGQFDHALFLERIRSAGYTEPRFVAEQRRAMIRQHLTDSIGGVTVAPKTYIDAFNTYENEQRAIDYVTLGAAQAGDIPQPTPEQIASYFEEHKAQFRAPEYRKIAVLRLAPEDVAKWIEVSDAEARKFYDERRGRYTTPGRRHVQQMLFFNPEEAQKAADRIAAGTPFETIAKERGLEEQSYDLGLVERAALAGPGRDPVIADTAFSLAEGAVSAPVKGRLGTYLIRVVKVEPDRQQPFEEVAAAIKQEIARDRTRTEIGQKHDRIEDERAGGATLVEAAQKAGLAATTIEAVDRAGRDPSGAPVTALPAGVDVLTPAFSTGVGVETDVLRLNDGGYVWFEVLGVTPSRERSLDEVKQRVEAAWRDEQIADWLKAKASAMLDKLKQGANLAELAAAENLPVQSADELRRGSPGEKLSPAVIAAVFDTPKGSPGAAEGASPTERVVFRVTDITVPSIDPNSPEGRRIEQALRTALSNELLGQYLVHIQRELSITINAEALARIAGGEAF